MNPLMHNYSLYLVTDREVLLEKDLCRSIELAIQGGVTVVQLREKNCTSMEFYDIGKRVKEITDEYNIPLIINDRLDMALAIDAAGVHLGLEDLPIGVARKILGPNKIIGASTRNLKQALWAQEQGADYLGVGAIFSTDTKKNTVPVSIEALTEIKASVHIPVVAIGGINRNNVEKVIPSKVDGVAVVSGILRNENILDTARELRLCLDRR